MRICYSWMHWVISVYLSRIRQQLKSNQGKATQKKNNAWPSHFLSALNFWSVFPHIISFDLTKLHCNRQSNNHIYACVWVPGLQSCLTLCNPIDDSPCQAPLSMGISWQEYWSGLLCPSPEDLPDPGIEHTSLCLLNCQAGSLPLLPPRSPIIFIY